MGDCDHKCCVPWYSGGIKCLKCLKCGKVLGGLLSNLRVVTNSQNQKNRRMRPDNTSGFAGVSWDKRSQKWAAYIRINGKRKSLGYHLCFDEAVEARKRALQKYGFHVNHGLPDEPGPITLPIIDLEQSP